MSNNTGSSVFTTIDGVRYLLDKYLTASDKQELRYLNNGHSHDRFVEKLIERIETRSGGGQWVPQNYVDELAENASAIIGSSSRREKLKNGSDVTVYETQKGGYIYEDKKGKVRDYQTGRFLSPKVFEE